MGGEILDAPPRVGEARMSMTRGSHGRQDKLWVKSGKQRHMELPCGASPRSLRWRLRNRVWKARRRSALPFANGVAAAVGRTPLIKLKRASEETGCTIL